MLQLYKLGRREGGREGGEGRRGRGMEGGRGGGGGGGGAKEREGWNEGRREE